VHLLLQLHESRAADHRLHPQLNIHQCPAAGTTSRWDDATRGSGASTRKRGTPTRLEAAHLRQSSVQSNHVMPADAA
jgi:hypothetical protein